MIRGVSTDAGQHLVTQSGSGAVAQSVQAELRSIQVSPEQFGAVGDDSTNDAAAIQAAHDALPSTGGVITGGRGKVYRVGAAVSITKPVTFRGAGRDGGTKLLTSGTNAVFSLATDNIRIKDCQIGRATGNANTIPSLISGNGAHQLKINRVLIGGADTAEIDLDNFYNVEISDSIFNARTAQSGHAIRCRGTSAASTTIRVLGNEINNYNQAIEYSNTFGTWTLWNIGVGNMRLVRYTSGQGHLTSNWAESGDIASTFAYEVAGPGAVTQIIHMMTRLTGTPLTGLVTYSGGGTQRQFLDHDFTGQRRAKAFVNTANQTIANVTETVVAFNGESYDEGALHDTATNNGRMTVPFAGRWRFSGQARWAAGATSDRRVRLLLNGSTIEAEALITTPGTGIVTVPIDLSIELAASDYIDMRVFQNSGGNLDLIWGRENTWFAAEYLGI